MIGDADAASAVAHDLKTPLSVIVGYAELLVTRDDGETREIAVDQILAAAERLSVAIDSLLGGDEAAEEVGGEAFGERPSTELVSRVILVDDDPSLRKLLRLTLPADGFEIAEASDGDVALQLMEAQRPHLVLLDWNMPTLSGSDVLRTVRERYPRLPVIVLTAAADQRGMARALGADAFLTKPFSPIELLAIVDRLIRASPATAPRP